jgi:hypothetical protein
LHIQNSFQVLEKEIYGVRFLTSHEYIVNKLKFSQVKVMTLLIIVGCQSNHLPIDERWMYVSGKRELSVSGIATTTSEDTYLVVHDNKKKGQLRAGLVNLSADSLYRGLGWPVKDLPIDLEALTNISGMEDQYIAMGSWGFCYWLALDLSTNRLKLIKEFRIPGSGPPLNLESLVLWFAGNSWYISWAHRGSVKEPSILFWGSIDLFSEVVTIQKEDSIFVSVPWPILDKRHMSDMDLDRDGILWAAATSDPGDDGPYQSGIYKIGKFQKQNGKMEFLIADSFPKQFVFQRNKVEALTIAGNKMVFATDDENLGAAINISINGK